MASNYPGAFDSLINPASTDTLDDPPHHTQHVNANDAIEAIQGELGLHPSGGFTTVRARLDAQLGLMDIIQYTTPGADTFDKGDFPGMLAALIEVLGGGGAGGGAPASTVGNVSCGSGGNSGAYARKFILIADLDASEAVVVGAGGSGVSGSDGNSGGQSSFDTIPGTIVANGGSGGNTLPAAAVGNPRVLLSGGSSTASGGDLNCSGYPCPDVYHVTGGSILGGADGAPSIFGGGAVMALESNGNPGVTPGAGGGGMRNSGAQSARTGGAGAAGRVIVHVFGAV